MQELHVEGRMLQGGGGPSWLAGASVSGFVISIGTCVVLLIFFCYSCYVCKTSPASISPEEDEETATSAAKPAAASAAKPAAASAAKSSASARYNTLRPSPAGAKYQLAVVQFKGYDSPRRFAALRCGPARPADCPRLLPLNSQVAKPMTRIP